MTDNDFSDRDSADGGISIELEDQVRTLRIGGEPQKSRDNITAVEHHLHDLPAELKLKILILLSDFSALSNLVHASPAYHDVYVANREAIWTTITLRELRTRGINILKPMPFIEVRVRENRYKGYVKPVLQSACYQFKKDSQVRLDPHQCKALLSITGWKAWQVTKDPFGSRQAILETICQEEAPLIPVRAGAMPAAPYHTLNFGPYSDRAMANMLSESGDFFYRGMDPHCTERDCCQI